MSDLDPTGTGAAPMEAPGPTQPRGLGEIVGDITSDLSDLVRQEIELAKVELKGEVTKAGAGIGMLGGAGVAAHLVLVFLSLALTFLLDDVMPLELAALITALVWAAVAGALGLAGRAALKKSDPTLPTTQQSLKEDVRWAKAQKN